MLEKILLILFVIVGVIFVFGVMSCMLWFGVAALDLFIKIIMPILLGVLILALIVYFVNCI